MAPNQCHCILNLFFYFFLPALQASETNPNVNGVIASTTGELQISIGDINDNGPKFYECVSDTCTEKDTFTGEVEEHSSAGVSVNELNIKVEDPDQVCSYNI